MEAEEDQEIWDSSWFDEKGDLIRARRDVMFVLGADVRSPPDPDDR